MTAILDRIRTVRNKLDSFENIDQAQDYISTLSFDDYFALKIFLKSWKNLKLFIILNNNMRMLPGTEMNSLEIRNKYNFETKYFKVSMFDDKAIKMKVIK